MEDLTGKQFGHYQIVAPLGEGGMAAVYKAYQPSMERYVAIKVLPRHMAASEEFVNRFRREAKLLAQLQHPHILPVFDYGEADGYTYIVMPFVHSGTLAERIQKQRLPLVEIRRLMTHLGEALSYAHSHGMIHRDIKPSNVLIDERGNCLLTDFGLARMAEASIKITTSGAIMGTPAYMSPEQGAGAEVDHRTDLYSLGIILYEMVTGRVPYTAETPIAIVFKHIQDPLPSPRKLKPDLPEAVELVLLKALAKDPNDRYQSADEFVRAIQKAIPDISFEDKDSKVETVLSQPVAEMPSTSTVTAEEEEITSSKDASQQQPPKKPAKRKWLVPLLIPVVIVLILGSVTGWAWSNGYLMTDPGQATRAYNISNLSTTTSAENYYATSVFSGSQDVYVYFNLSFVQAGTPIQSKWYYQYKLFGKEIYFRIATLTYITEFRDANVYFQLNSPLKKGYYRVDVFVDDALAGTRYFSVQ